MSDEPLIRFSCPHCGAKAKAKAANAGRSVKCPKCGAQQVVPGTVYMEPEQAQQFAESIPGPVDEHSLNPDSEPIHADFSGYLPRPTYRGGARKKSPPTSFGAWLIGAAVCVAIFMILVIGGMGGRYTRAQYNRVQMGMSRAQVTRIFGSPGETGVEMAGNQFMPGVEAVTWRNSDRSFAVISFSGGRVALRMQVGLP